MSKFYYKGNDINDMITSGSTSISGFQGFPSFTTTNVNYDKIDAGFANVFSDANGAIANRSIKSNSTTVTSQGTSQIAIPNWCNAVKVVVSSSKGAKGQPGGQGQAGGTGAKGAKGQQGGNSSCQRGQGAGGQGGEGGAGGSGGSGGAGGQGGEGGDGITITSNNVYVFSGTPQLSATISSGTSNVSISQGNTNVLAITSNAGQAGQAGQVGANGQGGGAGNAGNAGNGAGCCKCNSNFYQGQNGQKGTSGNTGSNGQNGNTGGNGGKGAGGAAGIGQVSYSNTTYGNIQSATSSSSSALVTVYFFAA